MNRAYSLFTIKSINEDQRIIEGIATTPTTDRMGDIVEPDGAEYKLPLPLLWMHNSREPVGQVIAAKVLKDGITITAKLASIAEPGTLKDRLDEAWQSLKIGLVRGLSIGFSPIESARIKDTFSEHFIKWDWLELSCVTIPANAEASILSVKSADRAQLAASGDKPRPVVRLTNSPGASGTIPKGLNMNIREQISALEAKRAANVARREEVQSKATSENRTKDETEKQVFDEMSAEIKAIDAELVDLRTMESEAVTKATVITAAVNTDEDAAIKARGPASGISFVGNNLKPGQKFARYALALKRAGGNPQMALSIVLQNKAWMDTSPELAAVLKTAVNAGDTTTSGWASELVYAQNLANEFIEYLRPKTIIGRIEGWRRVPFNVRMASQTAGSTFYWVGQGKAIPVSKLTTGSTSLGITKAAGLVVLDDELVKSSSPSAELLVRDDLTAAIVAGVDLALIDPNQGGTTNVQPASLLYNVTPVTPTGTTAATLMADIQTLFSTMIAANVNIADSVLVMDETTALALSLMMTSLGVMQFPTMGRQGGTLLGWPVIVSNAANIAGSPQFGHMIVAINPRDVFLADEGGISIEISNEASIEMVDSSSQQSTATSAGASLVSMFQTQSEAIKAVRYINWAKRRTSAAAFIQAAAYA